MYDHIFKQPSHTLLKKAISESIAPLTIIAGSGLSKSGGLPDWSMLRREMQLSLNDLRSSKESMNPGFSDSRFKQASSTTDYWEFFQLSKDLLGRATYSGIVRSVLSPEFVNVPIGYRKLLELDPHGFATLNLDIYAGEAFAQHNRFPVIPIYGNEIARKWQIINDERPFLVYLHGHINDHQTWILTKDERDMLLSNEGHSLFLSQVYLNHTVIFVGLSAEDVALSAPLLRLRHAGFAPPRLFWLTTRTDSLSDQWARENDVQKINYKATDDAEHEQFINAFVEDVKKFNSRDNARVPPAVSATRNFGTIPKNMEPRDIALLECEEVRRTLSDLLTQELRSLSGEELYDAFEEFCRKYRYPIQTKSFYKDSVDPDNVFFGYKINFPELGSGNFGEAFQAREPSGKEVCLKIMHSNIVANREMIGGFRRGVRSMQILTKNKVEGVVPIVESFEMPPTIVMDLVSGNSIQEIFMFLHEFPWRAKVKIIADIGAIVDRCHKLPEMILHRDIKPSNIMLKGLDYDDYTYEEIYVLDFDMSWHKNSSEKDIVFESRDDFGYLAPEQTDPARRVSTRSTKVDSYGLAMTAFAVFGSLHPMAGWSMSNDWESKVRLVAKANYNLEWRCLPQRVARSIIDATRIDQDSRLEFSSFWRRFEKISGPAKGQTSSVPIDIVAEEIIAIVADGRSYRWDDVSDEGSVEFASGLKIEINVDVDQVSLVIGFRYMDHGARAHKSRNLLMGQAKGEIDQFSSVSNCRVKRANINNGTLDYILQVRAEKNLDYCKWVAKYILVPVDTLNKID
ncbi:protein kinase domain-containing protein [Hoeflea olei]|uniref:protein kinase domain-containing protein n=1 Tax=Hoeflea olei TaxID=1480615 RepID=UPI0009F5A027|nr:SIR2 family protein [Hoeflea olei]